MFENAKIPVGGRGGYHTIVILHIKNTRNNAVADYLNGAEGGLFPVSGTGAAAGIHDVQPFLEAAVPSVGVSVQRYLTACQPRRKAESVGSETYSVSVTVGAEYLHAVCFDYIAVGEHLIGVAVSPHIAEIYLGI